MPIRPNWLDRGTWRCDVALCAIFVAALIAVWSVPPSAPAQDAAGKSPPAAESKQPAAPPQPAQPPAKPKPKSSGLDDDLFGDLTGDLLEGLEKPKLGTPAKTPPGNKEPPPGKKSAEEPAAKPAPSSPPSDPLGAGEDLGQEHNPLLDLGRRMRQAQSLIGEGSTGQPTQKLQDGIVHDLDKLIQGARST